MGCGAGSHAAQAPKETAEQAPAAENEVEEIRWATKSSKDSDDDITKKPQGFSTPTGGRLPVSKQPEQTDIELLDDIEDVLDCRPYPAWYIVNKAGPPPAAANGQEPPEAAEEPRRPDLGPEPKPLPKQQQEQAAKLAEKRKQFDNNRYQNHQRTIDLDVPGAIDTGPQDIQPTGPIGSSASTDISPKGRSPSPVRDHVLRSPSPVRVPVAMPEPIYKDQAMDVGGSRWDDLDELNDDLAQALLDTKMETKMETQSREQQHYEVKSSTFFTHDDEDMMEDILAEILDA